MNALQFEAVKVALKQDKTGFVLTLNIHPDEIPEELLRDFVGARYGVAMVRILEDESVVDYKNRVKQAGILCKTKDFQDWLFVDSEAAAIKKLYERCNISSRTELNGNKEAIEKYEVMINEYESWKEAGSF
jgi:hypothetical protein